MHAAVDWWWSEVTGDDLAQGDFLPDCLIPLFEPDYGTTGRAEEVPVKLYDCIVVTQSCDIENDKAPLVALCPINPISRFEEVNPHFKKKREWERVRTGRVPSLHLLASLTQPQDNRASLVADFREIYSLPVNYLRSHAINLGRHWRLQSPYLEHFSQAFARFFMRVGLPANIPPFK